jgi:hypothetical protein
MKPSKTLTNVSLSNTQSTANSTSNIFAATNCPDPQHARSFNRLVANLDNITQAWLDISQSKTKILSVNRNHSSTSAELTSKIWNRSPTWAQFSSRPSLDEEISSPPTVSGVANMFSTAVKRLQPKPQFAPSNVLYFQRSSMVRRRGRPLSAISGHCLHYILGIGIATYGGVTNIHPNPLLCPLEH